MFGGEIVASVVDEMSLVSSSLLVKEVGSFGAGARAWEVVVMVEVEGKSSDVSFEIKEDVVVIASIFSLVFFVVGVGDPSSKDDGAADEVDDDDKG